jgi:glycyl-tRNA synthetase
VASIVEFLAAREQAWLLARGKRFDVVAAVVAAQGQDPAGAAQAADALEAWVGRPDWATILQAFARCVRITREVPDLPDLAPQDLHDPAELDLWESLQGAEQARRRPGSVDDMLGAFAGMVPAVTAFFDKVLVMAEDPRVRTNRLALVKRITKLADGVVDFSRLEGF